MMRRAAHVEDGFTLFEGLIAALTVVFVVASAMLIMTHINHAQKAANKTVQNVQR